MTKENIFSVCSTHEDKKMYRNLSQDVKRKYFFRKIVLGERCN
jgi:hypothetical protein